MTRNTGRSVRWFAVGGIVLVASTPSRGGTDVYWDPNPAAGVQGGGGTWNTSAANWVDAGVNRQWSSANLDSAVFAGAAGGIVTVSSAVTAWGLRFDTGGYTLKSAGPAITLGSGSLVAGVDTLISAPLSMPGGLVKGGDGALTLSGQNTINGPVTVGGGTLTFLTEENLGAVGNDIELAGGALRYAGPALPLHPLASGRTVTVGAAGGAIDTASSLMLATAGQLAGAGTLTKAGVQSLLITRSNPGFTGAVRLSAGTLQLSHADAVNGRPINLSGGTLALHADGPTAFPSALTVAADATVDVDGFVLPATGADVHTLGDVAVQAGAALTVAGHNRHSLGVHDLTLGGNLQINDAAVVMNGALTGGGGISFGPGTRSPESLTTGMIFNGGGARAVNNTIAAEDEGRAVIGVTGGGTLAYGGAWSGGAAGAQNAIVLRDGATFVASSAARLNSVATDGAGVRPFSVIGAGTGETFELAAGFVADRTAFPPAPAALGAIEVRGATLVSHDSASLPWADRRAADGTPYAAGSLTFSGTAAAAWHVRGADQRYDGAVTLDAPTTLRLDTNLTHGGRVGPQTGAQFQIPSPGRTLTKLGPGTLRLAGDQGYAPGSSLVVQAGAVRFDTDPGAGWYTGSFTRAADGALTVSPTPAGTLGVVVGGSEAPAVAFAAPVSRLASLRIDAGGTAQVGDGSPATRETLIVHAIGIADGGVLDLTDGRLIVDYRDAGSPLSDVAAWVNAGRISGAPASPGSPARGIGFAEATGVLRAAGDGSRSFGGVPVSPTSVLVRDTLLGDANLDGVVDFADFQRLEAGFGKADVFWSGGDFDRDGAVTTADFTLLILNYARSADPAQQAAVAAFAATVPEPTCLAWLGVASLVLRRQRRSEK